MTPVTVIFWLVWSMETLFSVADAQDEPPLSVNINKACYPGSKSSKCTGDSSPNPAGGDTAPVPAGGIIPGRSIPKPRNPYDLDDGIPGGGAGASPTGKKKGKKANDKGMDLNLPGYLIYPKNSKRKIGLFLNGDVPEKIEDSDPSDDEVNNHPLKINDETIYKENPCKKYRENKKSGKNKSHKKGCKKAADHLNELSQSNQLPNCPDVGAGRCLQFFGRGGRCYVIVNAGQDRALRYYELINNCVNN